MSRVAVHFTQAARVFVLPLLSAALVVALTSCGSGQKTYAENQGTTDPTANDDQATTFLRMCKLADMTSETAKTMTALKQLFNEPDCANVRSILNRSEELDLSSTSIKSISFLRFFPHLEKIDISSNRVESLASLAGFHRLITLDISDNPIRDISALQNLTDLESFSAQGTPVSDDKTPENCPADAKSAVIQKFCLTTASIADDAVSLLTIAQPRGAGAYQVEFSASADFAELAFTLKSKGGTLRHKSRRTGLFFYRIVAADGAVSAISEVNLIDYDGDLDQDGIINGMEMNPVGKMNLKQAGANFRRKDVFVEMGYMKKSYLPSDESLAVIKKAFADAPVKNPDGSTGITIHLKQGAKVPFDDDLSPYRKEFSALKKRYFKSRGDVYHYMIWANRYNSGGSSGVSMGIPGKDFIVSLGSWGNRNTERAKIGTFMHELGHNLGLKHGGVDHNNYKPNYISIMNYAFQIAGVWRNGERVYDYQRLPKIRLDESKLDEQKGLGDKAVAMNFGTRYYCKGKAKNLSRIGSTGIDWNCDGKISGIVSADINNDGKRSRLVSQDNWKNIDLKSGILSRGFLADNTNERHEQELTLTMQKELEQKEP